MYCLKGVGLFIVIWANLANCQTDGSYTEGSGSDYDDYYGNTGCRVFKWGTKFERFLPKNQRTQRKLPIEF